MHKPVWTGIGACIAMFIFIIDGQTALEGALHGLELCCKTVIPSLFPFLFLSAVLTASLTGVPTPLLRPLGKLFRIPPGCEAILLPAFLGGYPAGAHCVHSAWAAGALSEENARRILPYCSNAGPAFLFGMAASLFPDKGTVWVLWLIHILSAFLVSRLVPDYPQHSGTFENKSQPAADAMGSSLGIMAQICGWVILFRIILCFLSRWFLWLLPIPAQALFSGFLELSNGCWELHQVTSLRLRFILCSGMLSFGGICVLMQTMSAAHGLHLGWYFRGKLIQALLSILLAAAAAFRMWPILLLIAGYFLIISCKFKNKCRNMEQLHV